MQIAKNFRMLIIDDNKAIHDDVRKILSPDAMGSRTLKLGREILGSASAQTPDATRAKFEIDSSYQGGEGLEQVKRAYSEQRPYAFVLVDVRMPPGLDGIETLRQIWTVDPDIQAVICTAYSDYSWEQITRQLGNTDRLLILKKPFDSVELLQMAHASVAKWYLSRESHQATKELQDNRDRLFITLQSIGDGVIATDACGQIVEMNPSAEKLLQCRSDLARGQNVEHVLNFIRNGQHLKNPVIEALHEARIVQLPEDTMLERHDGSRVPVADCSAPIISCAKVHGAVLVFRDVTQHRNAQMEIKRLFREAIEANRIKDDFLAIVSHELRSPLMSISAWIELMRKNQLSVEQTKKAIDVIERNAHTQKRIIEDLLDVSRIMSGKMQLAITAVDVAMVVSTTVEQLKPAAEIKSVKIEVLEVDDIPQISADAGRLQQIVTNLLSNSLKFTPPGGRIDIHLRHVGEFVEITVKDTGKGISAEFLPHIFERFRQEDSFESRAHGGLGLGLSIVSELVNMHGGFISAASEGLGKGATFKVTLPIHCATPNCAGGK